LATARLLASSSLISSPRSLASIFWTLMRVSQLSLPALDPLPCEPTPSDPTCSHYARTPVVKSHHLAIIAKWLNIITNRRFIGSRLPCLAGIRLDQVVLGVIARCWFGSTAGAGGRTVRKSRSPLGRSARVNGASVQMVRVSMLRLLRLESRGGSDELPRTVA